jgi:hypothetical protein
MNCIRCGIEPVENHDTGLGANCAAMDRKEERQAAKDALKKKPVPMARPTKPIKKRSDKRAVEEALYVKLVAVWKKGKKCGVRECGLDCDDAHHMAGREGALLLDTTKWFPTCREHHAQITTDSAWAIREGYSLPRNR